MQILYVHWHWKRVVKCVLAYEKRLELRLVWTIEKRENFFDNILLGAWGNFPIIADPKK